MSSPIEQTSTSGKALAGDGAARARALDPTASFCVTAPAGSGKTELLTQRMLALLARVERPEQVLAITFTRKAAAEMRDRVTEKLTEAQADVPVTEPHEQVTRSLAKAVLENSAARGWVLQAERFNIRTIDSLCADLTRQMPVLSALGGALSTTEQPERLFEQAVVALFAHLDDEGVTGDALRALVLHFDNNWGRVTNLLVKLLHRRGDWAPHLGQHYGPIDAEHALKASVADVVAAVLAQVAGDFTGLQEDLEQLANFAAVHLGQAPVVLAADADHLESWRCVAAMLIKDDGTWRKPKGITVRQGFPAKTPEKARLVAILEDLAETPVPPALIELMRLPVIDDDDPGWQLVLQLSRLLPLLLAELLLVFQREGVVDFTHIALAATAALGDDEDPTDLALRLDYQLEHILIDEFQDTSDQQFELLRRLTRGWAEHNATGAPPRTLFIVGDGMQSIYGFRYANVGLFLRARDHGVGDLPLEPLALRRNFRSQAGVVQWVNETFAQLLPVHDHPERGQVRHTTAEATHPRLSEQAVSLHLFPDDDGSAEAHYIAQQIAQLRSIDGQASVAILVRARGHTLPIIRALRQQGIPFLGRDLESLASSSAVIDLLALSRWLANPADDVASLALLRAPFCGLSLSAVHKVVAEQSRPMPLRSALEQAIKRINDEDTVARCRHLHSALDWALTKRDRLALADWVEQVWLRLAGPQALPANSAGDALRFLDLLRQAEREGRGLDVDWLELRVGQLFAEHDGDDNAVQLMTLHKSKGLQFDYVFMPGLHKLPRSNERELLRWHRQGDRPGSGLLIAADDRTPPGHRSLYHYLSWLQKQKEEAELRRLMYVGVTRAKRRVWLTAAAALAADSIAPSPGYLPDRSALKPPASSSPLGVLMPVMAAEVTVHPIASGDTAGDTMGKGLRRLPLSVILQRQSHTEAALSGARNKIDPDTLLGQDRHVFERAIGIVTHRLLELLSHAKTLPTMPPAHFQAAAGFGLRAQGVVGQPCEQGIERVLSMIKKTLQDPRGRWILYQHPMARSEWAVLVPDTAQSARKFVIDRSFVAEPFDPSADPLVADEGQANSGVSAGNTARWVIDYKTSCPSTDETQDAFLMREAEHYREQLLGYRDVVARVDDPPLPVRIALYFPALPAWYEIKMPHEYAV